MIARLNDTDYERVRVLAKYEVKYLLHIKRNNDIIVVISLWYLLKHFLLYMMKNHKENEQHSHQRDSSLTHHM